MTAPVRECQPGTEQAPTTWPSREVIAREIRRAMLDNPTDDSFNKRAEKREIIADEAAAVILARFAAALRSRVEELTKALETVWEEVNALGGSQYQDNSYDQGVVDTVAKALEIIERAKAISLEGRGGAT